RALACRDAEGDLLRAVPRLLEMLAGLPPATREPIVRWTGELALGMGLFVGLDRGTGWTALSTREALSAYMYYVAGTVGGMLDELIGSRVGRPSGTEARAQAARAIRFGLGLQATNVLQDLSVDRKRGWSYLPEEVARRHGTATDRLHRPEEADRAMGAVREIARDAAAYLDDGLEYVLAFPRRRVRVRLFCLWPLLLAVRTLTLVCSGPAVLVDRVRIGRREVRDLAREGRARALSNRALRGLYRRERSRLDPLIAAKEGES
ncbi:MAG: hypothetical protein GF346_12660, partial [Candidatus Eisenbacteria bacterium]|nr:hypothetical protein [Candidatus Latescibacterota bacterium]MBD3303288.1 hypothetical protein [Candidatus Eisenbacteria bacterium]